MHSSSIVRWRIAAATLITLAASACAPPATTTPALDADTCTKDVLDTLYTGFLTFGADRPVYPPWYIGDDPANGEGFESAVAYAVADELGYAVDDVRWIRVPFNTALAPGSKEFDVNLSQFSITEQRRAAVDFSTPYYSVTQAVVTTRNSPAAAAQTLDDLRAYRLGAQIGSTSHTAATALDGRRPVADYDTNVEAKAALADGRIDAVVADLPTAFTLAGELLDGVMVGQLPDRADDAEQFGIVLDHESSLTRCVSWAVDSLRGDGTLDRLEQRWLADSGEAPVLS